VPLNGNLQRRVLKIILNASPAWLLRQKPATFRLQVIVGTVSDFQGPECTFLDAINVLLETFSFQIYLPFWEGNWTIDFRTSGPTDLEKKIGQSINGLQISAIGLPNVVTRKTNLNNS
jgi:hypothetical protein